MKKLNLFGPVYPYADCINAKEVADFLGTLEDGEEFTVYLNSPGGSVFEGLTIYNLLSEYKSRMTVKIIGEASSIASVIACAAEKGKTLIAETALMLIHKPWQLVVANEDYIKKLNKTLTTIKNSIITVYQSKSTLTTEELDALMTAGDYLDAEDCVKNGIADEVYTPSDNETALIATSEFVKNELLNKHTFLNLSREDKKMTLEEAKAEINRLQSNADSQGLALKNAQELAIANEIALKETQKQLEVLNAYKAEKENVINDLQDKLFIEQAKAFCEEMFQAGKLTRAEINGTANIENGEMPAKVKKLIVAKKASEELYNLEVEEIKARSSQMGYLKNEIGFPNPDSANELVDFVENDYNKRSK